jgi:molybdopterin-guanine dinucleotide biosynthesis protein A
VECLAAVERSLAEGDRAVISFFPSVEVRVLPAADVAAYGDAERMFLNVNRPADRDLAERLLDMPDGGEEC